MGQEGGQGSRLFSSASYPDDALQAYVAGLGKGLAAKGERPSLPWTFRVVDDATVNAFAFARRLHLRDARDPDPLSIPRPKLASVIGHEIGHVTARHTVSQISSPSSPPSASWRE